MAGAPLADAALEAFVRREAPGLTLVDQAEALARACHAMAQRFLARGKLLAFGNGGATTDAQHISVEFVHPVIVGKVALPALSLPADAASVMGTARQHGFDEVFAHQLGVLGRPDDIALGVSSDGRCRNVLRGLEAAHAAGMVTVALVGGDGGPIADSDAVDHVLAVPSDDPYVVKEVHVTAYHVLWELVHVFLEHPDAAAGDGASEPADAARAGVEALYPSVYAGAGSLDDLLAQVARSTAEKAAEIVELRREVAATAAPELAACATDLADRFAAGGKLLTCGNGGSSSDAQEVAQDFVDPPGGWTPLPALCLTNDVAVVTALSNDVNFEVVFARQVRAFGVDGDAVLGISTSGGSANVLRAFEAGREVGALTIGLAGYDGGEMGAADTLDHLFVVPSSSVHRIQETQTTLYHLLRELTATELAGRGVTLPDPRGVRGPTGRIAS